MTFKRFTAIVTAVMLLAVPLNTFASILGSSKIDGYSTTIGEGTDFYYNLFYSDQKGVGQQSENYIVYTPNETVVPIITIGNSLYGFITPAKEIERLSGLGHNIIGGSNADYFSLQTGVPMGNTIVDGKIVSKDATGQDAIGIMPDGTSFISYFVLNSILKREDGSELNIYNINKFRQPYAAYLLTDQFSTETHNTTEGIDVVLEVIEGEMKIGTDMLLKVESITENTASAPIPKGKLVLTVDAHAPAQFLEPIKSLTVGETVTLSLSAEGDKRWSEVSLGMGSVGGRLLISGEVNENLPTGAAPRTAIGVCEDGRIILYTIDGRQSGHSYGVQLKTLAKRMKELGCVDALNLDGGGSTQIYIQLPGKSGPSLVNKPSDGRERKVSTFIFFENTATPTKTASHLHLYPLSSYILTGASMDIEIKATDEGYYPAAVPKGISYRVQEGKNSTVTDSGKFTALDNGKVTLYAEYNDISGSTTITCLKTPTDIVVKNEKNGTQAKSVSLGVNESFSLTAEAFGGYNKLIATDENFTWDTTGEIGTITKNGTFTASDKFGATGDIIVSAGEKSVKIPVTIGKPDEKDKSAYPSITLEADGFNFAGKITCEYNIGTTEDGIVIKADGKTVDFEFDEKTMNFGGSLPENWGKLTISVTNTFGLSAFKSIENPENITESPFADTKGHWAEKVLGYMYSQKVINGDATDGTLKFNPQKPMTRSEFAVMTANFLGLSGKDYSHIELPYSDLEEIPFWALDSFKALFDAGIVKGRYVSDSESCADPLATITRVEAATIVARTQSLKLYPATIDAPDKEDIPFWGTDGVQTLITMGAMRGYEDGTLKPTNTLTKAEAAKILYSIM